MPLLATVLYVADMSAGMARLEGITRSRAWRLSVWLRRLFYAWVPTLILAIVLVVVDQRFSIAFLLPFLLVLLGPQCWSIPLPRAGVRIAHYRGSRYSRLDFWYIQSPYLRRQHLRDVFWLPRR
jgi:hypothetical protein